MAYIGYTAKTAVNNANGGGNPQVEPDLILYMAIHPEWHCGYSYYNSHGTFVVVGPSMRTMPEMYLYII